MKYLIRSVKYLLYFVIVFCLCVLVVMIFSHQPLSAIPTLFKEGSMLPIALIFVGVAAIYPAVGYRKARLVLDGEWPETRDAIVKTMQSADYELAEEDDTKMVWRSKRPVIRFTRMWEDTITFERQENDPTLVLVDGPSRDTFRIASAVNYNFRMSHPQSEE